MKTSYTDETILTSGKYAFTKLCRVPADYLLEVYNNKSHRQIEEYVERNMETILMRKAGILQPPPLKTPCYKITYASEKDAKFILQRIKDMKQDNKKPVRSYECDKCGGWHLTSKPLNKLHEEKKKPG